MNEVIVKEFQACYYPRLTIPYNGSLNRSPMPNGVSVRLFRKEKRFRPLYGFQSVTSRMCSKEEVTFIF